MRVGLGICLVVLWALVVAALRGPQASLAEVSAWFLGGLLVVAALWMAYEWWREDWESADDAAAPFTTNGEFTFGLVLLAVGVPFLMAYDAVAESWVGERLAYWRLRWREWRNRSAAMPGDELHARAKALEGTAPRTRF